MKKLEIPLWVEDDFHLPEGCERLELETLKHSDFDKIRTGQRKGQLVALPFLYFIMPKKYTYDWPDSFPNGLTLKKTEFGAWIFKNLKGVIYSYNDLKDLISLPEPPHDAPIGTVITKGEK